MEQKLLEKRIRILERKLERSERNRSELEGQRSRARLLYQRLSQDVQNIQDQLIQSEKLASLGQLTAGIAHEIKNPLNFVVNFAEVSVELSQELRQGLERGLEVEDLLGDLEQNAELILQHGRRADAIVRSMMRHASGGSGERERVDINSLVSEFAELAYHGKRARVSGFRVSLVQDLGPDAGSLDLVHQDVGRVLINLLDNAFDAVCERGDAASYEPTVTVSTRRSEGEVTIRVEDNGPGIPEEIVTKLFEPFFSTKPTGSGTGLGLSLSYDIVTKGHGGSLICESEPGLGASFVVHLPA
jgi:two-component system, NtrC family, sensor kinase